MSVKKIIDNSILNTKKEVKADSKKSDDYEIENEEFDYFKYLKEVFDYSKEEQDNYDNEQKRLKSLGFQ